MSTEVKRAGLVFRLNPETIKELESIEADAVALARNIESLPLHDFQQVRMIFDRFYLVLNRVHHNLILVDLEFDPGQKPEPEVVMQ